MGAQGLDPRPVGDRAVLVELADREARAALAVDLRATPIAGVADVVEGALTLLVRCHDSTDLQGMVDELRSRTAPLERTTPIATRDTRPPLVVRTRYDGPDLLELAAALGHSTTELVARHQACEWVVDFPGFLPGFAYLVPAPGHDLPWPPVARHTTPRTRVPAGSVGLAGEWCGIYPSASPGGWQLIGTTDVVPWDAARAEPALLTPGRRVRFEATT